MKSSAFYALLSVIITANIPRALTSVLTPLLVHPFETNLLFNDSLGVYFL